MARDALSGIECETPAGSCRARRLLGHLSKLLAIAALTKTHAGLNGLFVDNECKVNDWVDLISRRNRSNAGPWSARFLIERPWTIELIADEFRSIGATIVGSGPADEYLITFPGQMARAALGIVVEQGGWLCEG